MVVAVLQKYVSIEDKGPLYELGGLQGPVINPQWLSMTFVKKLVLNDRKVYEHSVTDPSKKVKLTKKNYKDMTIYPGNAAIVDPSIEPNTYFITAFEEMPSDETATVASTLYVEIL